MDWRMDVFLLVINLVGTVAFAASGAVMGLQKRMDVFGVCILGLTTAVGGGIIRDLILGLTPPAAFRDPTCAMVSLAISVLFFFWHIRRLLMHNPDHFNYLLFWMDSLGLGAFTVVGVQMAYQQVARPTLFLAVFVGVLTGVGGGVLRDLLADETPYILVKHVYASASLAGALVCALAWTWIGSAWAMLLGMALVVLIRCLAAHYRWNLPKAKL
ncbi:MAG: trimeric intracellular cation channel family protein [Lawsonibacter sp.]|jgi:uncharacterized membrane protein YeiH